MQTAGKVWDFKLIYIYLSQTLAATKSIRTEFGDGNFVTKLIN